VQRFLFSVDVFDAIANYLGVNSGMDTFMGRAGGMVSAGTAASKP
jgi:hypothetical protein